MDISPVVISSAALSDSATPQPQAANDNDKVKSDWMTPAEALQHIRQIKQKLLRENMASQTLIHSPARRGVWEKVLACEQCLLWKYFRH